MKQFLMIQSIGQIYDLGSWKFPRYIGAHTLILLSTQLGTLYSNAIPILESNQRSAYIWALWSAPIYIYNTIMGFMEHHRCTGPGSPSLLSVCLSVCHVDLVTPWLLHLLQENPSMPPAGNQTYWWLIHPSSSWCRFHRAVKSLRSIFIQRVTPHDHSPGCKRN